MNSSNLYSTEDNTDAPGYKVDITTFLLDNSISVEMEHLNNPISKRMKEMYYAQEDRAVDPAQ